MAPDSSAEASRDSARVLWQPRRPMGWAAWRASADNHAPPGVSPVLPGADRRTVYSDRIANNRDIVCAYTRFLQAVGVRKVHNLGFCARFARYGNATVRYLY